MPSDQSRLRQVSDHISRIKAAEYPVVVGLGDSSRIVERPWQDMPEPSKLAVLQDSVDWSGVTNRDQAHILLSELDPGKLPDAQRNRLIDAAVGAPPPTIESEEKPLLPEETKALHAEMRIDYEAARLRDAGEDFESYLKTPAAERNAFSDLLRGVPAPEPRPDTRSDFERMLDQARERGKTQPKEQDRGGRER